MIQLTGEDTRRLGNAIVGRYPVKIPGGMGSGSGSTVLIGQTVGGAVGSSVFGLTAAGGIINGVVILGGVLGLRVSGQGAVISVGGPKGGYVRMPYDGVFTGWTLLADQVGDIVIDVWKDDIANFPPTAADTITAANKPTITGDDLATGNVVGWNSTFSADDIVAFRVDSATIIQGIVLELNTERT